MQRQMLKSKIHRATITDCDVDYVGSVVHVNDDNDVIAVDSDPTVLLGGEVMRGGSAGGAEEPPDSSEGALL